MWSYNTQNKGNKSPTFLLCVAWTKYDIDHFHGSRIRIVNKPKGCLEAEAGEMVSRKLIYQVLDRWLWVSFTLEPMSLTSESNQFIEQKCCILNIIYLLELDCYISGKDQQLQVARQWKTNGLLHAFQNVSRKEPLELFLCYVSGGSLLEAFTGPANFYKTWGRPESRAWSWGGEGTRSLSGCLV